MKLSAAFWRDKCVIITGASSGIGRALAEGLAACRARVGLVARREIHLQELAAAIASRGGRAALAAADVTVREQVFQAVGALEAELGPCDVLIANAGVYRKTPAREFDVQRAELVLTTNLLGVVYALGAVLPGMVQRQRGHLAAVASVGGMIGLPGAAAYCASKQGVVTLLQSLRADLWRTGIRVTAVCPGYVDTPMITDEERATLRGLVSADEAAWRIAWAIERGRAEYWFPWWTALEVRLARLLPPRLAARILSRYPEMEETGQG
ncbi:MAG TPA: SDR family NAD(P)-dependent oxidoreductase [Candidatus Anammoximicrobium sp.]|nr:SDR family NAD(P)-dependent oxidoreductase [Candidatus Anammoximicrobium sp.]